MSYQQQHSELTGKTMIKIVIGGDFCPVGVNEEPSVRGDAKALFHDLLPIFQEADCSLVNLEVPLIKEESPISKIGPVLGIPSGAISGIKEAGIGILNLANNHIMDHGAAGLESTLSACHDQGIDTVGAGKDLAAARKILIREYNGIRIALAGMAEHEFSIAGEDSPGANPLNLINFLRDIRERAKEWDYLIVLLHAGVEHYHFPTPGLRELCRFLAESGANTVICQHTHCPGCWEEYQGAFLVYGQGNLLFDLPVSFQDWNRGFLVVLNVDGPGKTKLELVPHIQSAPLPGVRRIEKAAETSLLSNISERSEVLKDEKALRSRWEEYCRKMELQYLNGLHGYGSFFGRINNKLGFPRLFRSNRSYASTLNHIRCESHREALITILETKNRDG